MLNHDNPEALICWQDKGIYQAFSRSRGKERPSFCLARRSPRYWLYDLQFRDYENTNMLDLPLACGVAVIAAHMGLGRFEYKLKFWRNFSKKPAYFDDDYFIFLYKLNDHPNIYADISAILALLRARALCHLSSRQMFIIRYCLELTIRTFQYSEEQS